MIFEIRRLFLRLKAYLRLPENKITLNAWTLNMKTPHTLRFRITLYFCGYLAVLLTAYSFGLTGMIKFSEDMTFERQLSEIAGRIVRHIEAKGEMPYVLPEHVSVYSELENVPDRLRKFVTNRPPGTFEIEQDIDYHAAIVPIPSTGQMLYVFYDVASIETTGRFESFLKIGVAGIGLTVLLIGWILARSLSNRILNPITELAEEVKSLSLDEDSRVLRSITASDEVGTLAQTINQLLKRISQFSRREREFTSHASHELRTPVTVIKGAVEILKGRSDKEDTTARRPLGRIDRALADIERLIDTFLVLARQGKHPDKYDICNLQTITEQVVESYQHILDTKPVEVKIQAPEAAEIKAPSSLLAIALGNLVRNAFQYTMRGKVTIMVHADRVSVIDSGPGLDSSRKGMGLGLTIVERVCETMNWQFIISGGKGEGTRADLIFRAE